MKKGLENGVDIASDNKTYRGLDMLRVKQLIMHMMQTGHTIARDRQRLQSSGTSKNKYK